MGRIKGKVKVKDSLDYIWVVAKKICGQVVMLVVGAVGIVDTVGIPCPAIGPDGHRAWLGVATGGVESEYEMEQEMEQETE